MKIVTSILFFWLSICAVTGKSRNAQSPDAYKIDSVFNHNITVLEMFLKDAKTDSTGASMRAVYILERMTGIISNGNMTYIGKIGFKKEDVCQWKAWYAENKGTLLWDKKYRIVWRKN